MKPKDKSKEFQEGYDAHWNDNKGFDDNPYKEGTKEHEEWFDGCVEAFEDVDASYNPYRHL